MRLFVKMGVRGVSAGMSVAALLLLVSAAGHAQTAVPVKLVKQTNGQWQLLRSGKPYVIHGAGGTNKLDLLQTAGGNSIRTWGAENADRDLAEAGRRGLTMTLGIWLGHPEHGFKYDDPKQIADQLAKVEEVARKYKNSPNLLVWGLGNEMEASTGGNDDRIWRAVEDAAKAIKRIDPNHPVMTVIAEIGENGIKAKKIAELCPSVDILGVNSYGGLATLPERLKKANWVKPYIVTEFGTNGPWEVGKTSWGAPLEPTSTEKAGVYAQRYAAGVADQKGWCLGAYAFLWGDKVEATPTWFGMFLPGSGEKLGAVDAMTAAWTGKPSPTPVPRLTAFSSSAGSREVAAGSAQTVTCTAEAATPLTYSYEIRPDAEGPSRPEPGQKAHDPVEGIVPDNAQAGETNFTAPTRPGIYRLYVTVRDGKGGAAAANLPFKVVTQAALDAAASSKATVATLPYTVFGDGSSTASFTPSGWMGNRAAVKMEDRWSQDPHSGTTCLKVDYTAKDNWAGVVWQYPADDWGDRPESRNLTGAKKLTFWARGAEGGETVDFSFGLLNGDKKYTDSASGKLPGVALTKEWKRYSIDLSGKDLSRIKTGFSWVVAGTGKPVTFFLDDIRYE